MARNHTDKGVRVSWKIVPAVTEVWYPHPAHSLRLRTGHAFPDPQWAQRKPVGQRSRAKYARHASSVLKFASNSVRLRGYSSTISAHYVPVQSPTIKESRQALLSSGAASCGRPSCYPSPDSSRTVREDQSQTTICRGYLILGLPESSGYPPGPIHWAFRAVPIAACSYLGENPFIL